MFDLIIKICKGYKLNVIEVLTPSWLIGGQSRSKDLACVLERYTHILALEPFIKSIRETNSWSYPSFVGISY